MLSIGSTGNGLTNMSGGEFYGETTCGTCKHIEKIQGSRGGNPVIGRCIVSGKIEVLRIKGVCKDYKPVLWLKKKKYSCLGRQ